MAFHYVANIVSENNSGRLLYYDDLASCAFHYLLLIRYVSLSLILVEL